MGSLAQNSSGAIRCSCNSRFWRRFRRVLVGCGGFRCRWLMRFRRVPVQMADEVPEGSGADGWWGSGGFRCRWLRFRRVRETPVQIADKVPEGSGAVAKILPRSSKVLGITHEFIPKCVARVPVSFGGLGVRLCSRTVVSMFATVRNRSQPSAVVR